jgi:membrane protease subunit (stomatin/prohibitin family)
MRLPRGKHDPGEKGPGSTLYPTEFHHESSAVAPQAAAPRPAEAPQPAAETAPAAPEQPRKFCTNCGKPVPGKAAFCTECGTPVGSQQ